MIGIRVDVVDIERFRRSLERTPTMRERLFTSVELDYVAPKVDPVPSLAARFAAREAVMKFGNAFRAVMGADSIRELVERTDLDLLNDELRADLKATRSKQKTKDLTNRLKIVESIREFLGKGK